MDRVLHVIEVERDVKLVVARDEPIAGRALLRDELRARYSSVDGICNVLRHLRVRKPSVEGDVELVRCTLGGVANRRRRCNIVSVRTNDAIGC